MKGSQMVRNLLESLGVYIILIDMHFVVEWRIHEASEVKRLPSSMPAF